MPVEGEAFVFGDVTTVGSQSSGGQSHICGYMSTTDRVQQKKKTKKEKEMTWILEGDGLERILGV